MSSPPALSSARGLLPHSCTARIASASVCRRLIPLLIVPEWRFFGTNPGRFDFYLLYRDRLVTNEITDWVEIPLIVPRPWHAFAFNPSRRSAKAIMDVVIHLSRELDESRESIVGSMPYLTLLNHVSAQPSTELSPPGNSCRCNRQPTPRGPSRHCS